MLFALLKIPAKLAFGIYCRDIQIHNKAMLRSDGPLLIAANHPNSFLDAIIVATLFRQPVHSLARGDAFANDLYSKLLQKFKMLPVYRISEGAQNLEHNYKTFDDCKNIFRKNGIVLIFCEGGCTNEWHLRPLKKGTARLAITSWEDGIPLKVIPLGINYSSFYNFGKNVQLNFGTIITQKDIDEGAYGKRISLFNTNLQTQLQQLVIEIDKTNPAAIKEKFAVPISTLKKTLLFLPAVLGWIIHAPLYYPLKKIIWLKTVHHDHFDSIMTGTLFFVYPFYLLAVALLCCWLIGGYWWITAFLLLPFFAWSYVQLKAQF